jgi:sugar phosphate permease
MTRAARGVHDRMRRLRWLAFALVVAAYVLSFFHRVAPATIATDLQQAFAASATALGALAATYFYIYTVMQIPTGVLVDTLGPRRILTLGGVMAGTGALLFGLADSLAAAALGRLLVGLGVSVTFIAMLKLNAVWFHDRHFGSATGLAILLGNVGAVLGAAPLAWALAFASWRTVFVLIGVASLLIAAATWLRVRDHPGEAGLPSLRELDGEAAHPPHAGHWRDGLVTVLRNRATWPAFWVNLGLAGAYFAFAGLWAVPYLRDVHGLARGAATVHTSLLLAGFALGALGVGTLSDRLGRRKPVLLGASALHLLSWLPLLLGLPLAAPWGQALFFLMGLGAAGFTLSWACVKEVNPHALSGMATSVANTGAFLGTGILQPLVGHALDRAQLARAATAPAAGDYRTGLLLLFGCALFGFVAALFIRETYGRYRR